MTYDTRANQILQTIYQNPSSNDIHFEESGFEFFSSEITGHKDQKVTMSATTDKDYIDARLKAMSDSLDQRLETAAVKSDGRLEVIETRMDARVEAIDAKLAAGQASMEQLLARKFAEFDSTLHKSTADTVKWVAGTVLALGVIGISLMTFLLNNVAPKAPAAAPAPLIFYGQPAPAAAPPVAPATK